MTHTYQIDGMHCSSCINKVKNELLKLGDVNSAEVQLEFPQATITMEHHIPAGALQHAVAKAGAYTLKEIKTDTTDEQTAEEKDSWITTYKPLLLVFTFITGIAFITAQQHGDFSWMDWMDNFMGGFFIAFSFFKLINLRGFADSYSTYDLLAKNIYSYGYIYPFIELGLGVAYLTGWQPFYTNVLTIFVMGFSSIGVIQSLVNKRKLQCACLGAMFNLPMSTVTLFEDMLMAGMALASLFSLV